MTVLLRSGILRLCAGAAGVIASAGAFELEAQVGQARPCTAPTTLVIAFPKAPDRETARKIRDKVWSTFKDFAGGHFCLVPTANVDELLTNSQFPIDTALGPVELASLAGPLRADEVLQFEAVPVGRSYQLTGRIILARDKKGLLRDSVPVHPAEEITVVYKSFLTEVKRLQAMLELEKRCFEAAREEKWAEAEAAARKALAAFPPSNIARMCLASALREARKNSAEVFKLTDEVLAKDPGNELALQLQLVTALADSNQTKYAEVGGKIIAANPASPLAEDIIANLAQWKKTDIAIQLIDQALRQDPENLTLRKIEFRIRLASDNLKEAQKKGEELFKIMSQIDTAGVDTAFVNRMVNAYARDSQPQKAAEWLMRGVQKWPGDVSLAMSLAQTLRNLGQTEEAIKEYKRVIQINPQAARGVRLYIADAYGKAGQADSSYAWLRRAAEAGDDKVQAAALVQTIGLVKINAAQQSKSTDDWRAAISYLAYADSLNPADKAHGFYWGVAAFSVALNLYNSMTPPGTPSCAVAKEAKDLLLLSNEKVRAGAMTRQETAAQILTGFGQLLPAVDQILATPSLRCPPS